MVLSKIKNSLKVYHEKIFFKFYSHESTYNKVEQKIGLAEQKSLKSLDLHTPNQILLSPLIVNAKNVLIY